MNWKKIWLISSKFTMKNKMKDASLQMIRRFDLCQLFLQRYRKGNDVGGSVPAEDRCSFWSQPISCIFTECLYFYWPKIFIQIFSLSSVLFCYTSNKANQYYIIIVIPFLEKENIDRTKLDYKIFHLFK